MPKIVELRPDKCLLDPDFEKYQFSGNTVPVVLELNVEKEVLHLEPGASQDSWLEARLFAFHNHLYENPFNGKCCFINSNSEIWQLDLNGTVELAHMLSQPTNESLTYNPSISFAAEKIIVASNGQKNLEILFEDSLGKLKSFIFEDVEPGVVMDSIYAEEKSEINVSICNITEINGKKHSQLILYSYHLSMVDKSSEGSVIGVELSRKRILRVKGAIEYVNLEKSGSYLYIASQDTAIFVYDSLNPLINVQPLSKSAREINIPKYCWSQDDDTLTVWLKIPENIEKNEINIDVGSDNISIKCEENLMISGESAHRLDTGLTTWTREKDTLKVDLFKCKSGLMWKELIKGDTGGECLPNEALAAEVHSRLAHMCTEQLEGTAGRGEQPVLGFNAEQLEECDVQEKENLLQRIHLDTHKTMHLVMLGANNRILFTHKLSSGQALCLRHDHDGCVWMPREGIDDQWELKHVSTIPGFGYVEASKTNKKFCVSPPDGSYVAVVEHIRHIFIYGKSGSDLRVGFQRIVDLSCDSSPIMGATASNHHLNLLTKDKLYQLQVTA